eukprot:5995091-Prymnesium_polylepis.1
MGEETEAIREAVRWRILAVTLRPGGSRGGVGALGELLAPTLSSASVALCSSSLAHSTATPQQPTQRSALPSHTLRSTAAWQHELPCRRLRLSLLLLPEATPLVSVAVAAGEPLLLGWRCDNDARD